MVRASIEAEKIGIRTATIVGSAFAPQAKAISRALGFSNLALAKYPGMILLDREEEFRGRVAEVLVDQIIEGLAGSLEMTAVETEPGQREIVFSGTLDEVQEHFHHKLWSDGLPIIPPTIERVERFLRFTNRSPEEVLGRLLPEKREATVWNVAVNGVMAGCRPEYMPILLAIVEAISEPVWRIEDAGATPGWDPLVIISGPIIKDLNFNFETSAMRVGRQANTSIGRFLRLYMRNIPGLRIAGNNGSEDTYTDKGTIAGGVHVALAENEDAVAAVGWKTFGEGRGFAAGENVVTVQSVVATSPPIYVSGEDPAVIADKIAQIWGNGDVAYWSCTGMRFGKWHPLLVMTPSVAQAFARGGWTKDDLKRYLAENVKIPAGVVERYWWDVTGFGIDLSPLAEGGVVSKEYVDSSDPNRLFPVFPWPEWIEILVAGDPGRNQVKGYTNNHQQGPPVSKVVRLPAKWQELLGLKGE